MSEFNKMLRHHWRWGRLYFWRNRGGAEIDLVFEEDGRRHAYELKFSPRKRGTFPISFQESYEPVAMETIIRENFWRFLEGVM